MTVPVCAALRALTGRERVPDATTLLKFRKLLHEHKLGEALFAKVGQQLQERGLKVNTGTIVDATIIAAPSSTKNADKARDPDMHQTRKGQQWYFGMKLHIGVDSQSGLAHSAVVTAANVHDKHPLPDLLHGNERRVYGDSAYASQKTLIASKAPGQGLHQPAHPPCGRGGRSSAGQEPQQVTGARSGRACLCGGKAPVGIHQGALSRAAKERHACVHGLGAGQHLPCPRAPAGTGAPVRVRKGSKAPETGPVGQSTVSLRAIWHSNGCAMDMTLLVQHCLKSIGHSLSIAGRCGYFA